MKKTIAFFSGILSLALIFGILVIGCDEDGGGGDGGGTGVKGPVPDELVGLWVNESYYVEFSKSQMKHSDADDSWYNVRIDGKKIEYNMPSHEWFEWCNDYTLSGDTLTFTGGEAKPGTYKKVNWRWSTYDDSKDQGTSTITMTRGTGSNSEQLTFSGTVNKVSGQTWGFAACTATPIPTKLTALRNANGISFKCKGDGKTYRVEVVTPAVTNSNFFQFEFTAPITETTITIPYSSLTQLDWGDQTQPKTFSKNTITEINFVARAENITGSYTFTIWDLQ